MPKQYAVYGKLVQGAVEDVSGWRPIREVEMASTPRGPRPWYGDCVAMVADGPAAPLLGNASRLLAALTALEDEAHHICCTHDDLTKLNDLCTAAREIIKLAGGNPT